MLTWCKLHTDILGDAKLLSAARKGARHLVVLPWLMAWARAHDETDCGRLVLDGAPVEPEDVAYQLPGVTSAQVRACMNAAESVGVLVRGDDGALRFASWELRSGQHSSKPSDRPEAVRERVRKHREAKRPAPSNTDDVTPGNAGNALRNTIDREEEKEIEKDQDPSSTTRPREAVAFSAVKADDAVRPRLPAEYRPDLDALLDRIPTPAHSSWLRSMAAKLDGMHPPAVSPEALGEALRAFGANGASVSLKLFDGYVRNAAQPPPERGPPSEHAPRNGRLSAGAQSEANSLRGIALLLGEETREGSR